MSDQESILLAIAAMAAVTAACRCGGYFLLSRMPPTAFIRDALSYLPGCIFAAYVFPALLRGRPDIGPRRRRRWWRWPPAGTLGSASRWG